MRLEVSHMSCNSLAEERQVSLHTGQLALDDLVLTLSCVLRLPGNLHTTSECEA
jgi:hypothetical protein